MKSSKFFLLLFVIFGMSFLFISPVNIKAQSETTILDFDRTKTNQLDIKEQADGVWQLETTGRDPWIYTIPLNQDVSRDSKILSFQYFCPEGLNHLQIFFSPSISEESSRTIQNFGMSEGWTSFSVDLSEELKSWGKIGDWLRIDFGSKPGIKIQIRNLMFRPMTDREIEVAAHREEKKKKEAELENHLTEYLSQNYQALISRVQVDNSEIIITGESPLQDTYLCEVEPYQDVTENITFETASILQPGVFSQRFERFINRNGFNYDRLLSKWVLAEKTPTGFRLLSHARYPDEIKSMYDLPAEVAKGRKGLGGFSTGRGHIEDLDALNITSATVNIWFTRFMYTKPADGRIEHSYNGKSYYFGKKEIAVLDSTFRTTARKGIITAAILLVGKAETCPDKEIGKLLQHPDMDPAGIYSMPNMTNPASVDCYAAAIDFLASRYSRPDKKYGRLNHWIIHNEIDAGWVWTNMGEKSALIYMDTYIKSMRLCYAIARSYNPHSEVFISLTHHWAWTSNPRFYPSKDLMAILIRYTKAEGDFQWAIAQHPYPQSLYEPKTWLDTQVDFTFDTPLITFKNLEVINAYIKLPELLYKGKTKRTLWLSENGTNSKTYSDQDLKEQAAGFAYAWKKMEKLSGIDGFQWHNWIDNRGEGGLRIGLRRFPDDAQDPGGAKPVWYLYQAADTRSEKSLFDPYLKVIGIKKWKEIVYTGRITGNIE
jgi:hypothetical protein